MSKKILGNITNIAAISNGAKENSIPNRPVTRSQSAQQLDQTRSNAVSSFVPGYSSVRNSTEEENVSPAAGDLSVPFYMVPEDEIVENIDMSDLQNEFACAIYAEDVYNYLKEMEIKHRLPHNFMQIQTHINPRLRAYCIDWQVEVHRQLSQTFGRSLQIDTLFLSISILDRFLAKKTIAIDKLNLVGLGSFYIACKFEETYYPSIDQLLRLVPEAGKKDDVLRIERIILNELRFSLGVPTSIIFLKRFAKAAHADSMIGMLSRFMSEYSMSSYSLTSTYLPSQIAAAATAHALRIVGRPPWSATLIRHTGYTYEDLRPCLTEMKEVVKRAPLLKTQAIFRKYSEAKYLKAASICVQKI